jgi:transporter family protein
MDTWLTPCLAAIGCWGVVGLLQKLAARRIGAESALLWYTIGLSLTLPVFRPQWPEWNGFTVLSLSAGLLNGLGTFFLFLALERGKASVLSPLTALYPLITVALAIAFLGETLGVKQAFGAALAVCGGLLLSREEARG